METWLQILLSLPTRKKARQTERKQRTMELTEIQWIATIYFIQFSKPQQVHEKFCISKDCRPLLLICIAVLHLKIFPADSRPVWAFFYARWKWCILWKSDSFNNQCYGMTVELVVFSGLLKENVTGNTRYGKTLSTATNGGKCYLSWHLGLFWQWKETQEKARGFNFTIVGWLIVG